MQHDMIFEVITTAIAGLMLGMAGRTLLFPSRMSPKMRQYTALLWVGSAAVVSSFIPAVAVGVVVLLFSVIKLGLSHGREFAAVNIRYRFHICWAKATRLETSKECARQDSNLRPTA